MKLREQANQFATMPRAGVVAKVPDLAIDEWKQSDAVALTDAPD